MAHTGITRQMADIARRRGPLQHWVVPIMLCERLRCSGCGRPVKRHPTNRRWFHVPGNPFPPSITGC